MSVMEQRYRAVLDVEAGSPVTEVAEQYGVSRQSVHAWVRRYRAGGLGAILLTLDHQTDPQRDRRGRFLPAAERQGEHRAGVAGVRGLPHPRQVPAIRDP
nr:helix-turn-helix domain-containing protein [Planotetraspora kaengkrachanensis]